jgi:monoamine oxidase
VGNAHDARTGACYTRPFDDRPFFAGEASHGFDFSTVHDTHASGGYAAEQAIAAPAKVH